MSISKLIGSLVILVCTQLAHGTELPPYVDGSKKFVLIENTDRQAEAWGTCAAAYDVMAALMASKPNQAQYFNDLGNGASMAVVMTHVSAGLDPEMGPAKFNALWNYSKTLAETIPETQRTMILADFEAFGEERSSEFVEKVGETVKICLSNLEGQQAYIDAWRDLAKSGLLAIPGD